MTQGISKFPSIGGVSEGRGGFSLLGGRRSLTGWIMHPKTAPRFFRLPRRGIGMGLIEMPHSFQRTEVFQKLHKKLYNYNYLLNISKFTAKNIFKHNHSDEFFKLSKYFLFIELSALIILG